MRRACYCLANWAGAQLAEHPSFLFLLAAFVTFRSLSVVALRPGGFLAGHGPDQLYYFEVGRLSGSGQYPFLDFWMEYPPLMPWLAVLAYRISLYVPPWGEAVFWFNLIFRFLLLPFEVGTLVLVYASAGCVGTRQRALQVVGLWALLFAPFYTFLAWFEPLPLFFLVLGLYGLLTTRPLTTGLAIGLGFMAKVFPAILLPVGWFVFRSLRQRVAYLASAVASAGILLLPFLIVAPEHVMALLRGFLERSSWETVWALLEGYAGYGIVAPLAARADPTAATLTVHLSTLPWPVINLGFAALYVSLLTRRIEWEDKRRVAAFALVTLSLFILWSKGYSPQWVTYLATVGMLALPTGRGLSYALLLDGFLIAEWPVAFILIGGQAWFLVALILLRTAVTVLLTLEAVARALPAARAWHVIQRVACPAALLIAGTGAVALLVPAWQAYGAARLEAEPLAPLIESVRTGGPPTDAIMVIQPGLLERLHPYLPGVPIQLFPNAGGVPWQETGDWLAATLAPYERVWLVYDAAGEPRAPLFEELREWLDENACSTLHGQYGSVWAGRYVLEGLLEEQPAEAQFANGLRLVTAAYPREPFPAGSTFCLHLTWAAGQVPSADYAVFVHLVSGEGRVVAQGDAWPATPTSTWLPDEAVTTAHEVLLPIDLAPGLYSIWVGLYEIDRGTRARLAGGSDRYWLADLDVRGAYP